MEGKSSNTKQGGRHGQALSRMMVVDHSVRLRDVRRPRWCVVTTYNESRDHGEQRLGSYLDTLKSEHLCATSLDRDTSVDLGGPKTVLGTSSRAPTTSATARFYTGALDEVFSSGTLRIRDVRNSDPQETCCAEFRSTIPRVTILFRTI